MANSEDLQIIDVKLSDVDAGIRLSDEAKWNQVHDDWQIFINQGKTVGFRDPQGQLIATAAALPYESTFGFIAMVLVTRKWRRRGLATRLVDYCIDWLQKQNLIPVLDATADGAKVYQKQGFSPLFELDRWQIATPAPQKSPDNHCRLSEASDIEMLIDLDAEAVGSRRAFLINEFIGRPNTNTFVSHDGGGFVIVRQGRRASQIGPIVAQSQDQAIELISEVVKDAKNSIFIDVPAVSSQIGLWLKKHGFTKQRSFLRMALGREQPFGATNRLFSSAGPEFG